MANKTFKDFNLNTPISIGDYIVGYKTDENEEYRMSLFQLIEFLNNYFTSNGTPSPATPPTEYIESDNANLQLVQDNNDSAYVVVNAGVTNFNVSFDSGLPYVQFTNYFNVNDFNDCHIDVTTDYSTLSSSYIISPSSIYVGTEGASVSSISIVDDQINLLEVYTFSYFNTGSLILGFNTSTGTSLNSAVSSYPTRTTLLAPTEFYLNSILDLDNILLGYTTANQSDYDTAAYMASASWVTPISSSSTGPVLGYKLESRQYLGNNTWSSWHYEATPTIPASATSITFRCLSGGSVSNPSGYQHQVGPLWDPSTINNPAVLSADYRTIYNLPSPLRQQFRLAAFSETGYGQWAEPVNTFKDKDGLLLNGKKDIWITGNNTLSAGTRIGLGQHAYFCDQAYGPEGLIPGLGYVLYWVADGIGGSTLTSVDCIMPTPTPTPTPTLSATPTPTPTLSATPTPTPTPTPTLSATPTPTPTPTPTLSATPTPTPTLSATPTPTPTLSATPTPTPTPTPLPADLTVKDQNDANAVTYTGQTSVTVGGEFSAASTTCDPVKLYDGSAVTSLYFDGNSFGGPAGFSLYTDNAMSSLTNLIFAYTGLYDFDLSDTSGFDNVTDITFSNCGYNSSFSWTDMSGMGSLSNVSMNYCGYFGFAVINDTVNQIPESAALAILNGIINDPFPAIPSGGNCTIDLYTTGTSTLQSAITTLTNNGWIVNITT